MELEGRTNCLCDVFRYSQKYYAILGINAKNEIPTDYFLVFNGL
jgi:hypothetical protein